MALRIVDGVDHYTNSQKLTVGGWGSFTVAGGGAGSATVTAGIGRTSAGMRMHVGTSSADFGRLFRTVSTASGATFIGHFGFKISALPTTRVAFFTVADANTAHVYLIVNNTGTISVKRGSTVLGTTTNAISAGNYYHIVLKVVISDASGTVDLLINNASWLSLSSQDTKNTANATWDSFSLAADNDGAVNVATDIDFDDIVLLDGVDGTSLTPSQGSTFNTSMGDVSVVANVATGDGNYTQFTSSSGGTHFDDIDDVTPNDDTDYNEDGTANDRDSYTYPITSTRTILALALFPYVKQTSAAAKQFLTFFRAGGVNYDSTITNNLGTSYAFFPEFFGADPSTSAAWAGGSVEAGVKVVS
jgi:hypothetical protein